MSMWRAIVAVLLVVSAARAQDTVDRIPPIDELLSSIELETPPTAAVDPSPIDTFLPPCARIEDEETRELCWRAYRGRLAYYEDGLEHRTRVFAWQHMTSRVIFFTVLGLVAFGALLAWMQFRRGLAREKGAAEASPHVMELSAKGLKVSSPVLGVIILTLSLGFFYLYLRYVYPIHELF